MNAISLVNIPAHKKTGKNKYNEIKKKGRPEE